MHRLISFFIYIFLIFYGCNSNATFDTLPEDTLSEKRIPFTLTSDGTIICNVNINDSIPAKFIFDTGTDALIIDSTFWHTHFPDRKGTPIGFFFFPFGLQTSQVEQHTDTLFFNNEASDFIFNPFYTTDLEHIFYDEPTKGLFNILSDDTVHIWEINFENNYIQIHNEFSFKSKESKITIPLKRKIRENGHQQFFINLPIKIICGNDTLVSNTEYRLDTGSPYDIFYHRKDQREVQFLEEYGQNIPILHKTLTGRVRRNIVKCIVFDDYIVDSFRIYNSEMNLIKDLENDADSLKTIGTNFLKRFNLFLDLKNNIITFIPIKKEHIMIEKFKYETNSNVLFALAPNLPEEENLFFYRFLELESGDINIFKEMGIKPWDILVSINGVKINGNTENYDFVISEIIKKSDTIEVVIKRKRGKEKELMIFYYNKPK